MMFLSFLFFSASPLQEVVQFISPGREEEEVNTLLAVLPILQDGRDDV